MTTVTVGVNKNGVSRSVTLLASRVVAFEVISTVVFVAVGFVFGKLF